jgi:hypothetical protein
MLVRLPLCGRLLAGVMAALLEAALGTMAYHCGGAATATVGGGALAAQPARTTAKQIVARVV